MKMIHNLKIQLKEVKIMMAMLFAINIAKGKRTFAQVPKFLKDKGIAEICLQNGENLDKDEVIKMIESFDLNKSSKALKEILLPNGAKEIMDKILS